MSTTDYIILYPLNSREISQHTESQTPGAPATNIE